jgi:hypothetical protein
VVSLSNHAFSAVPSSRAGLKACTTPELKTLWAASLSPNRGRIVSRKLARPEGIVAGCNGEVLRSRGLVVPWMNSGTRPADKLQKSDSQVAPTKEEREEWIRDVELLFVFFEIDDRR